MSFAPGALVRARGREWVVQPQSTDDLLILRPLGGTDDETTGVLTELEPVETATFPPPDPEKIGDDRSCRLLRDAVRLSFRSGAGPFRSFGRLSFEPRPYQLVPLLMALKQDPVRLLIADDVGVGKTVEAALIVRELLDRGEITRFAVLCPPHLAEQWQLELSTKFHLDAAVVLSSTAARLERGCGPGESLFDRNEFTVVSLDFIKSERRRDEFLRHAPELILVDEAHTCAFGAERGGRHQRNKLVSQLANDPTRHVILTTATPHSGKQEQFRSLLGFLDKSFESIPDDLGGPQNEPLRRKLAQHLVQRRRADLRAFMAEATTFPDRETKEETYKLSEPYAALLDAALAYARETVQETGSDRRRTRVRWWSVLALLRSLASSPAAAASTLRTRATTLAGSDEKEVDDLGRAAVLDLEPEDDADDLDLAPGADDSDDASEAPPPARRKLLELAKAADAIGLDDDQKLKKAIQVVKSLLADGFQPIVFCRFIPTALAVMKVLQDKLPKTVEVDAVTGLLTPDDREERIAKLGEKEKRVLVATDCLSEGINLQQHFNAIVHYDLAWNPTRHEQREGRVDRFGQPKKAVRVVTLYGTDNGIDGFVLNVLIRKHIEIREKTGVAVPVPADLRALEEAILQNVLLAERERPRAEQLRLFAEDKEITTLELHQEWVNRAEKEKRSRTLYAQEAIKVDEVAAELAATREALGSGLELRNFVLDALKSHGAVVAPNGAMRVDFTETSPALRDVLATALPDRPTGDRFRCSAAFALPAAEGVTVLDRTHPFVEALADYVLSTALDPQLDGVARRAGVATTRAVSRRTTVLLVRFRFHVIARRPDGEPRRQLAEEARLLAFEGPAENPQWLPPGQAEALLGATPDRNTPADIARNFVQKVVASLPALVKHVEDEAHARADVLLTAHQRVRAAALRKSEKAGVKYAVEPHLPADVLGVFMFLPAS